jgi:hypothetical protein
MKSSRTWFGPESIFHWATTVIGHCDRKRGIDRFNQRLSVSLWSEKCLICFDLSPSDSIASPSRRLKILVSGVRFRPCPPRKPNIIKAFVAARQPGESSIVTVL